MRLPSFCAIGLAAFVAATATGPSAEAQSAPKTAASPRSTGTLLKLDHTKYQLDNGLTVILHQDKRQPLVAVNINVNVGSRDEAVRRTGFAHLFEHLMFMGTKRVPTGKFDAWMEREGGSNNAWTSQDRTDYYDVGPSHTLPLLLWLEADRVSALGKEMTQAKLDVQRGVVRNERRQQVENQPYGAAELRLPELLFPKGHPYHHPVIGSHEDLEAATVGDVKGFFAKWYVPSNMSLVVAGDFDEAKVRPLIDRYFGHLPKVAQPARPKPLTPAVLTKVTRETLHDAQARVPKIVMAWLSPALYAKGDAELDLLAQVLSDGKASRLHKSLVFDKKLAISVSAHQSSGQLQSSFQIEVIARPGADLDAIEKAVDAELERVRKTAVSDAELGRAQAAYEHGFVARMQSLNRRAGILNSYEAVLGKPDHAAKDLARYLSPKAADVLAQARTTLDPKARVILRIKPKPKKGDAEKGDAEKDAP